MKEILYGLLVVIAGNSIVSYIPPEYAASVAFAFCGMGLFVGFIGVLSKR